LKPEFLEITGWIGKHWKSNSNGENVSTEAVKPYNSHIKTFPNSLFAGLFGFKEKHILTLLKVQINQLSKIKLDWRLLRF
jgi:hypothetical protein